MKYFIHLSVWRNSKEMAFILDRGGLAAYGGFMIICEAIAEHMGMDGPACEHTLSLRRWARILGISPSKFLNLLSIFSESGLVSVIHSDDADKSVTIAIPKLWELRDEYSRKSRHGRDTVRRVSDQSEEVEESEKKGSAVNSVNSVKTTDRRGGGSKGFESTRAILDDWKSRSLS